MKKNILILVIGIIIGSTITAGAAYVYTARDINYQPSDENWSVNNVQEALTELKTDVNTITNKVEGIERIYKAGEIELVALVSDDSFYKDSNGKYVLSNSDTGRSLLADTSTYKSLASTDDCIGIFESDVVSPFSSNTEGLQYIDSVYSMNNNYFRELGINNFKFKDKYLFTVSHFNSTAVQGIKVNGTQIPLTDIGWKDGTTGGSFGVTSKLTENDVVSIAKDYAFNAQLNILSDYSFEIIHLKNNSQVITKNHKKWIGFISLNASTFGGQILKINGNTTSDWSELQNRGSTISLSFKDLTSDIHVGDTVSEEKNYGVVLVGIDY